MICLIGESASGKSTIAKEIVRNYKIRQVVTYTTRHKRKGEIDGLDYHFISQKKFQDMIKENEFAEYASYNGWFYGTAFDDCTDHCVIVITPHGLRSLKKNQGLKIISFYIKTDRRARLIRCLQRGDDIEEAYRRSLSDSGQYDGIEDEVNYIIENNYITPITDISAEIVRKYEK